MFDVAWKNPVKSWNCFLTRLMGTRKNLCIKIADGVEMLNWIKWKHFFTTCYEILNKTQNRLYLAYELSHLWTSLCDLIISIQVLFNKSSNSVLMNVMVHQLRSMKSRILLQTTPGVELNWWWRVMETNTCIELIQRVRKYKQAHLLRINFEWCGAAAVLNSTLEN